MIKLILEFLNWNKLVPGIHVLYSCDAKYLRFGFKPRVTAFPGIVLFFKCFYEGIVH